MQYPTSSGLTLSTLHNPKTKGRTRDWRQTGRIGEAWSRCLKVPPPVQPPTTKPVMHHWVSGQNCLRPWPETCFMSGHYYHWKLSLAEWEEIKKSGQSSDYQLLTYTLGRSHLQLDSFTKILTLSQGLPGWVARCAVLTSCSPTLWTVQVLRPRPTEVHRENLRFPAMLLIKCLPTSPPIEVAFHHAKHLKLAFECFHLEKSFFLGTKIHRMPSKNLFLCNFRSCNTRNMFKICGQKKHLKATANHFVTGIGSCTVPACGMKTSWGLVCMASTSPSQHNVPRALYLSMPEEVGSSP